MRSPIPDPLPDPRFAVRTLVCYILVTLTYVFVCPPVFCSAESRVLSAHTPTVMDSTGKRLGSIFEGLLPDARLAHRVQFSSVSPGCKQIGGKPVLTAWRDATNSGTNPKRAQNQNCTSCGAAYIICESRRCGQYLRCGYFFCYSGGDDYCAGYYSCDVCGGACTGDFECDSCNN